MSGKYKFTGRWLFSFICFCLSISAAKATVPDAPSNCRIQDYYSQLGIDTKSPRFSWIINDVDRGEVQSAYEIIVASMEANIDVNIGDQWSSGKIISAAQYDIRFEGMSLKSCTKYWWKIRAWDKDGNVSPWSSKNSFVTGFLNSGDWDSKVCWISASQQRVGLARANWIWDNIDSNSTLCKFRSLVQIPEGKSVVSAKASITADSSFTFYINDKLAAQSNDWTTVTDIDLVPFLHSGSNSLFIQARKSVLKKGSVIARIEVRLNDGELILLVTDNTSWEASTETNNWKPACIVAGLGNEPWFLKLFKTATVNDHSPLFRKVFNINNRVKEAYLFISGLGVFDATLNGKKIGNQITPPAWTDYDKSANYLTFDVANLLQTGDNTLGVMLGNGWFDYQTETRIERKGLGETPPRIRHYGIMRLFSQLNIQFEDGSTMVVVSDPSWKTSESPFTLTHVFGSEQYDARLEQVGWNTSTFSDNNWKPAEIIEAPLGLLESQKVPPVIERQVYNTIKRTSPDYDVQVFDLGQNMNGQFEIKVSGPAGRVLKITPGEVLDKGRVRPTADNYTTYSTYTLKGKGLETWRLTFSTVGFRYIEINGITADCTKTDVPYIHDVKGYFTYSAANDAGTFSTSDQRYNQIYDLALKTLQSNQVTIHTDCPTYEKLGWQEVVASLAPSYAYLFNMQPLWIGLTQNLSEAQRPNGLIPNIVPDYTHGRGDFDDSPAWGTSMFAMPWQYYWTYGDKKILEDNYQNMKNYLVYLKTKEDTRGVIAYGLGDWMSPAGSQAANVEGAIYVWDVKIMRDIATVLNRTDDASFFSKEFIRLNNAYNNAFFDSGKGCYLPEVQVNQTMPLALGLVPYGKEQFVFNALLEIIANPKGTVGENGTFGPVLPNHASVGDIGVTYLWRVLGDLQKSALVDTMIMQTDVPGYYNFIKLGLTTIPENWRTDRSRSMNHDMYAGILEWFYRSVSGISNTEAGYGKFRIKPAFGLNLADVKCTYQSVRGTISSSWIKKGNKITLKVGIPTNTIAEVFVPARNASSVSENNKTLSKVAGVKFLRMENGNAVYLLGSGNYVLTSNLIN
ncbi:alfa-L-rhamnosidase [Aquipluma nitroreducens]|uniref:alpha-L-rhamnosidase n=1 Tax=Aquipluma nitroreducens TaxID=2010828 RepID=A0A5K7S3E1_9BACT|nr:family 78 glycoside hydrolase catalytic domain [Aquipluma nitroreducens]BBE16081.1 alfa-L-rhamnosidase [Aquipluma nitroreducens]